MADTVKLYIIYFFFYSVVGWMGESFYCSVPARKWINRGFLTGPLCPIYGTGTVLLAVCLGPLMRYPIYIPGIEKQISVTPVLVFLCGIVLCDVVEYITSVLLEKLFHARWWDYSEKKFNIKGRICLGHSFYWGAGSLLFLYGVHPIIEKLFDKIPRDNIHIILGALLGIFLVDLLNAVKNAANIKKVMDKMNFINEGLTQFNNTVWHSVDEAQAWFNATIEKASVVKEESTAIIRSMIFEDDQVKQKDKKEKSKLNRIIRGNPLTARAVRDKYENVEKTLKEIRDTIFPNI